MTTTTIVKLAELAGIYSIHRLSPAAAKRNVTMIADALLEQKTLFAVLKSADELSLVCDAHLAVTADRTSGPWRAIRVLGELDFALTGILAGLTTPLAEAGIPVFAISSYDTDYLLVAAENAEHARTTLIAAGFEVEQRPTDSNTNA